MAGKANYLRSVIFLGLILLGASQSCQQSDLGISTAKTGRIVGGKPEWEVTLNNPCNCAFAHVVLACQGFQTAEQIDPEVLNKSGDDCSVNNSNAIAGQSSFKFQYAWDTMFSFTLKSAEVACS